MSRRKTQILEAGNNCYVLIVDKTYAINKPAMSSCYFHNLLKRIHLTKPAKNMF